MNRPQVGLLKNLGSIFGNGGYVSSLNLNDDWTLLNSNPKIGGR